jgi:hypothetical protein
VRPKPKPKLKSDKPASPLDAQKRKLAEREEQIQAEMERHKRLIEEAPRLAE